MTPNQRIFENIYKMSEMAQAKASHIRDFIKAYPALLDVYKDPSHVKPGTPANEQWKQFINDFYTLHPEDAKVGNKSLGKSFSDSIYPIVKGMNAAANEGKSDKTIATEDAIHALKAVIAKLDAAGLSDCGPYESVALAIEGLTGLLDDLETQDIEAMEGGDAQ